jgi:CHAT domain-containing protein
VLLLLVAPLRDTLPGRAQIAYSHAYLAMVHGHLERSQQEAEWGVWQFHGADPAWASKFQLLEAEDMLRRGFYGNAQRLAAACVPDLGDSVERVRNRVLLAQAAIFLGQFAVAEKELAQADILCRQLDYPTCGEVFRARGSLALKQGNLDESRRYNLQAYAYAQSHRDPVLEEKAALNLGIIALDKGNFDVAQDWSRTAYRDALALGDEDVAMMAEGNLGQASFPFGDTETARTMFLQAAQTAERLGDLRDQYLWTMHVGDGDAFALHYADAIRAQRKMLELAQRMGDPDELWYSNLKLAYILAWSGNPEEAEIYLHQADKLAPAKDSLPQLLRRYVAGQIAVRYHRDAQAEALARSVLEEATSMETWRFEAAFELASALEREGRVKEAESTYRQWLTVFEAERAQKTDVASHMTYLNWGLPLYSGYIHMLNRRGRIEEALAVAEQARARTLNQKLGATLKKTTSQLMADPRQIAHKTGATLLYYWLGEEQSYLWVVTARKIALFELPAEKEIVDRIVSYRHALTGIQNPVVAGNEDGQALYSILAAPAAGLLRRNAPVILLDDGELGALNFETLLAPGNAPGLPASSGNHFWIEDVTLRSAPSLAVLAAATPSANASGRLLLMGDAVAASPDYPELVMAPMEMELVEKHFSPAAQTVFAHRQATPAAYLKGAPERYSFIHFVSHGVASRNDPLDSSIILSRPSQGDDAFKLYARDILRHPIQARLVTISACYGSGDRVFAGEGLVGLSWAFLHAGARNVIGSLWEVSDESAPRLMDSLYRGLQQGMSPDVALRQAKLALLHSSTQNFHAPFYWASFQEYSQQ